MVLSYNIASEVTSSEAIQDFKYTGLDTKFEKWLALAEERLFSVAVGNRVAHIALKIMNIGFAKVLYGVNELGADIETANPFVIFAPDGTCSFNSTRTKRGFAYGAILDMDFDGLLATNNSMPNGCGYSLYELIDPLPDDKLIRLVSTTQKRLGKDQLNQLGKGNHFSAIYYVKDPISGEDTGRRFVVVHCSGHVGIDFLYYPHLWLNQIEGYHIVQTPHDDVIFLEGEARELYLKNYEYTNQVNANNRDVTMNDIFTDQQEWRLLEKITHQGLRKNGKLHLTGTQIHDGTVPIAFNPEEGLIAAKINPNLRAEFLNTWEHGQRVKDMGLYNALSSLNFAPHGGGYEFRFPVENFNIQLDPKGINHFQMRFKGDGAQVQFKDFRKIRNLMTFRQKTPLIQKLGETHLIKILYHMP
ncbi:MAG: hypothetical protein JSW11_05505, partial [Candidatus Heimdallarchaeota archaeon]